MTPKMLFEQLVALHAAHGEAHRGMLTALERNDLLALVQFSRTQGSLCTQQGALLAEYLAAAVAAMPDVDPAYRQRVTELARQLRDEHREAEKKAAG